jgi:YbbR domain-containing protein
VNDLDEWLKRDFVVRILAILVAIILWTVVITNERGAEQQLQTSMIERIISASTTVKNLDSDLVVIEMPRSISIRVRGSIAAIRTTEHAVKAEVDLSGMTEGLQQVRVIPIVNKSVEVLSVEPAVVNVKLDRIIDRNMPVKPNIIGTPQQGYLIGSARTEPVAVVLHGPSTMVQNVRQVLAPVDISGAEKDVSISSPLRAVDDAGRDITDIQISPDRVKIDLPVGPGWRSLEANVIPKTVGDPLQGYVVKSITPYPAKVKILTSTDLTTSDMNVETEPVRISGAFNSFQADARLVVPEGSMIQGSDTVKVDIVITAVAAGVSNTE